MRILNIRTLSGPNVHHYKPVLNMIIDLEEFTDVSSTDIPEFNKTLISLLPGLNKHFCSPGYEGGFVERLQRGTYFAHIIEHVALELSEGAGIGVGWGKSVYDGEPGRYKVSIRYKCEQGMKFLLRSAVEIVRNAAQGLPYNIEECLEKARKIVASNKLGPSTQAIVDAAVKRNIPWKRLNEHSLIQLGYGKHRQFIQATTTSTTSDIAVDIAQDKFLTKRLMEDVFVQVPAGKIVANMEEAIEFFKKTKAPVAVKPLDGNHGRGITLNITKEEEIESAFNLAMEHSSDVLMEECVKGNDYRLVFVGGKLIAAAHRIPAHVTGNGKMTIKELVDKENTNPLRGEGHEKVLTKIHLNEESLLVLNRQGKTLEDIPEKGQVIHLKETANLSTGGCADDVTDEVHPEIKRMCERAARAVGLDICGIDFIAEDIKKPLKGQSAGLIEVNAGPGLRMHQHPSFGKPRDVGGAVIENMFGQSDGRIPIVAITGTNGKTTVSRLLNHIFTNNGQIVGNTTSDGIYINNELITEGDTTGPASASAVLSDPSVDIAVLETARGGIVKRGLAFDYCDVAIFTNVKPDHIGQDGIESVADILKIKSLIVEQVKPGGTVILNADCQEVASLATNPRMEMKNKKLIFYSAKESNSTLRAHLAEGGHGYFVREGKIIEALGKMESVVAHVADIPLTMNGTADFHVMNAMASIAAAHALKVSDETILESLSSFNQEHNRGRTNIYRVRNGYVMLDYGHNPDAITNISAMARKWNVSSITGVISAPGDRSDEMIKMCGLYSAYAFDKIIIREDEDKRGRGNGEIPALIMEAIKREKSEANCKIISDSRIALQTAIDEMQDDELVIYFYDDLETIDNIMKEANASLKIPSRVFKKQEQKTELPIKNESNTWLQYSY